MTPDADATLLAAVEQFVAGAPGPDAYDRFMQNAERALLEAAVRRAHGNQSQAARLLGLPRPTLHAKLQRLAIRSEQHRAPPTTSE
jgi:DNA-binding NtrC family response regulator